jgi:hypothetical protein
MESQLSLQLIAPRKLSVDRVVDTRGIMYLGDAVQQFDGTWRCLANVAGALCLVEVTIKEMGAKQ